MSDASSLAPALWGIPVVDDAAARDAAFPLASRSQDQRVFNKTTGNIERWSGSAWTTDLTGSGGSVSLAALAASSGASLVGYTQGGTGAVTRTIQSSLRDIVRVTDFLSSAQIADGLTGSPTLDCSAAINAAFATGRSVDLCGLFLKANNLTQSAAHQHITSTVGFGVLQKNANGDLLTLAGNYVTLSNVVALGDASTPTFTGHNIVATGVSPTFWLCASQWAYGRALKATKDQVQVFGSASGYVWQTADATATGYDMEIGVSGTATLYHYFSNVRSSQATGGLYFIDVGGVTIVGGQVGKVTFKAGTSPAGVGVNKVLGTRMTGAFLSEISNTVIAGGAFSGVSITFAAGTSGQSMDPSTILSVGHVLTNLGNQANPISQSIGAAGTQQYKYGDDAALAIMDIDTVAGIFTFPSVTLGNNKNLTWKSSTGSAGLTANISNTDNVSVTNNVTDKTMTFLTTGTTSGSRIQFNIGGTNRLVVDNGGIRMGGSAAPYIATGTTGTPESAVTGIVGSLFPRTDGGPGRSLYTKGTGTSNTGWVPVVVNGAATITYSASMTPDCSLGDVQTITATNSTAFTINAPTNPVAGQRLRIRIRNTSGGALGVATWNAVFKMVAWVQPATGFSRSIDLDYDGTNWIEAFRSAADVGN